MSILFFFFVLAMMPFLAIGILLGLIGALLVTVITGRRWTWVCWVAFSIVGATGSCAVGYSLLSNL